MATVPEGRKIVVEIKIGPDIIPELKKALAMSGLDRLDFTLFSVVYASIGYPIIFTAVVIRRVRLKRLAKTAVSD